MPNIYDEVLANSHYRETKTEIVKYYQGEYPSRGKKGMSSWKQHLVKDLYDIIYPPDLSTEEKSKKLHNLTKRFDSGKKGGKEPRLNNPEPRNARQYKELGQTLPPIPNGKFHITGTIWFKYMDETCQDREVDEELTLEQSKELAGMAYMDMLQSVVNHYMSNDGTGGDIHEDEPMLVASMDCAESDLHIEVMDE